MVSRAQSIVLAVFVCLFICGPVTLAVCEKLFGEEAIPEIISTRPAKYLSGGVESVNVYEHLNFDGFKSKQFQTSLETRISNNIPAKATAILSQAALQRGLIIASNGLFSWDCYPTYYGSGRLYIPKPDALTYMPTQRDDYYETQWMAFADGLKTVAAASPEKRFLIYVVQGYTEPAYDPAYSLMSVSLKPQECADYFTSTFSDTPNISVLTKSYDAATDYYTDFFRTDHHWNIQGAFEAYHQICNELQLKSIDMGGIWDIEDYYFSGATARWGLDLLEETVFDCNEDFSFLSVALANEMVISGSDHDSFWEQSALAKRFNFYDAYYNNLGDCQITGGRGSHSALLIGNSYIGAVQRPLASSYEKLAVRSSLWPSAQVDKSLIEEISATDAEDILFVSSPGNFAAPDGYFKLD